MNIKHSLPAFGLLIAFGIFTAFYQQVLPDETESIKLHAVTNILEKAHFSPLEMNDEFSNDFFDSYLDRMDFNKRFFTKEELAGLERFRYLLDDEMKNKTTEFYHEVQRLLEVGITRSGKYVDEFLADPIDFSVEEEISTDSETREYAANEAELRDYWRKSLKFEVLDELRSKLESQQKKMAKDSLSEKDKEFIAKTEVELETEIRESTEELYDEYYERLADLTEIERFGEYLNALTNLYDPHSDYFSPRAKEDFDISMGRSLEGIGARLLKVGEHVTISSIVPGGPAWKQKDLEVDDKIISVAQDGEEAVSVVGWRTQDVVPIVRGDKGTKVILTVERVDGSEVEITIVRDKVILDEGKAKSVILDREGVMDNVGYIRLPRFYADFNDPKANSCADDIKIELEKLMAENVDGIILDLRNNGGGSLSDVIEMSGFFIEDGPVVQVKGREKNPKVYRDRDESIVYDGPLIVMVNHNSASASEILAAALQDYDRAIIVGSNSTFGKGTVQRFLDLDRHVLGNEEHKPLGELKVTMQKFYRVNGGSTQLKGVIPDIILPDSRHFMKFGENNLDNPLAWTEIEPVAHDLEVAKIYDKNLLKQLSERRIAQKEEFSKVLANAKRLKELREQDVYPLSMKAYDEMMDAREADAKQFKDIFTPIDELVIENLEADLEFIQADSSRIGRNENWITNLKKDHYIDESIHILKDLKNTESYAKKED